MSLFNYLLYFIIELTFNLFALLVLLRFILQVVKASFLHPIIQLLVKITNPLLLPVRRITPIFSRYDWSCILLVTLLGLVKYTLYIVMGMIPPHPPLIIFGLVILDIIRLIAYILLFSLILRAIASWLGSSPRQSMILGLLNLITDPLLRRIKWRMQWRMIDFKPMVVALLLLILLQVVVILESSLTVYGKFSSPDHDQRALIEALEAERAERLRLEERIQNQQQTP